MELAAVSPPALTHAAAATNLEGPGKVAVIRDPLNPAQAVLQDAKPRPDKSDASADAIVVRGGDRRLQAYNAARSAWAAHAVAGRLPAIRRARDPPVVNPFRSL